MLFPKGKVTIESLKETDPSGLDALVAEITSAVRAENTQSSTDLAAAQKRIAELEAENNKAQNHAKIREYGAKLDADEIAEQAIKDDLNFNDALLKMVDAHLEHKENVQESFEDSGSEGAGENPDGDSSLENEPKTFVEAYHFIAERDNISLSAASKKAIEEYPELYEQRDSVSVKEK